MLKIICECETDWLKSGKVSENQMEFLTEKIDYWIDLKPDLSFARSM